jgi:hypothetical protein
MNQNTLLTCALAIALSSCSQGGFSGKNQPSQNKETQNGAKEKNVANPGSTNNSSDGALSTAQKTSGTEPLSGSQQSGGTLAQNAENANQSGAHLICAEKSIKIGTQCVRTKPVYRWYSDTIKDHFYTMAATPECQGKTSSHASCGGEFVNESKFVFEGIEFYTLENTEPTEVQLAKMFRLYSPTLKKHFYTLSTVERDKKVTEGFRLEGYYLSLPLAPPATKPIHQWFNPQTKDNFYSFHAGPDCAGKTAVHPSCGGDGASRKGEVVNESKYTYVGIAGTFFVP